MMKNITIALFLLCANIIVAQENTQNKTSHSVGLNAGFITGVGPSYRYWTNNTGIQITALPIKADDDWTDLAGVRTIYSMYFPIDEYGSTTFISLGAALFQTLKQHSWYKVFAYVGNHLLITEVEDLYNVGGGVGLSFEFPVSFNLMIGYQAFDLLNDYNLLPSAEIGVFYKFKN